MKLLHIRSRNVVEVFDANLPPYAILSHTWTVQDILASEDDWATDIKRQKRLPVHHKVLRACESALAHGVDHLWVDSLCIDTSSSADLDEAVHGSLRRLRRSAVCLVLLDDLPDKGPALHKDDWSHCKYWTRAWTLQELIIPPKVEFFDRQWIHRGSKSSPEITLLLSDITHIPSGVLRDADTLSDISLAVRMSWMRDRVASRQEDIAYSLSAIMGVMTPVRYGEGDESAFLRLQEEILRDTRDTSIFAWKSLDDEEVRGLLARSPSEFNHFASISRREYQAPWTFDGKISFSSKGIHVDSLVAEQGSHLLLNIGRRQGEMGVLSNAAIYVRESNDIYVRVRPASYASMPVASRRRGIDVARNLQPRDSAKMHAQFRAATKIHVSRPVRNIRALPVRVSLGVKRNGAGELLPPSGCNIHTDDTSSSSLEVTSSMSDSDCTEDSSDSDGASSMDEDSAGEDSSLQQSPVFQQVKTELVEFSYKRFKHWMSSTQYRFPPDNRLPPRKRAKTAYRQPTPYAEDDEHDAELVIISKPDGYFHLACPFYVSNMDKYRSCLLQHDLQSIEDVIHHLRRHHVEPPYCPICHQAFNNALERDKHVRANTCSVNNSGDIDGINDHQKSKLCKRDRVHLGEALRWQRIWATVFPHTPSNHSPYLHQGVGKAVSMARDYWSGHDLECKELYLKAHSESGGQHLFANEGAFAALSKFIRDGLLGMVFDNTPSLTT